VEHISIGAATRRSRIALPYHGGKFSPRPSRGSPFSSEEPAYGAENNSNGSNGGARNSSSRKFPKFGFPELGAGAVLFGVFGTVVEVLVARPPVVVEEQSSSTTYVWYSDEH